MSFSIRTRLYGGFFILFVCLLLSSLVASGMLNILNERINRLIRRDVEKVRLLHFLDRGVLDVSRLERNIILSDHPEEMSLFATEISRIHEQLQQSLTDLGKLVSGDRDAAVVRRITELMRQLLEVDREIQQFGMLNSNVRALRMVETEGADSLRNADDSLIALLSWEGSRSDSGSDPDTRFRQDGEISAVIQEIRLLLMTLHKDELHMILSTDEVRMNEDGKNIEMNEKKLYRNLERLALLLGPGPVPEDLSRFKGHLDAYLASSFKVRTLTLENGNNLAIRLSRERGMPIVFQLRDALHLLSSSSEKRMLDAERQSDRDFLWASGVLFSLLTLSFFIGATFAIRIARDVNLGLNRAITTLESVSLGNFGPDHDGRTNEPIRDEFGHLMQAIERMVAAERRVVVAVKQLAVGDVRVSLVERSSEDELIRSLNLLARSTHDAANVAEKLAIGDLDVNIQPRSAEDLLLHSLKNLVRVEQQVADMAERLAREDVSVTVTERSPSDRLLNAMKELAGVLRERAELRRMLMVSEKMSSIGQFSVRVAHEINNPLSTAAMGLQNIRFLMAPHGVDSEIDRRLTQVENNIGRATHAARQMMEYSWTGQLEFEFFDLKDEIDEVIDLIQADAQPFEITVDLPESYCIRGDRMKIGQVLRNLMQNALDARTGPCRMHLQVLGLPGERLAIQLRDWGPGLAPGLEGKIFEPFFTTKKSGLGVGLGLPICYSIVAQHGGTLDVANASGGGVVATVTLPLNRPPMEG
ncbi:MAG: MCP four helix bundle domain-containing protein [Magnetococcales bacterium]|nr:MCP four helix bundle domain-containing protein [Magnetococcales bacterium]